MKGVSYGCSICMSLSYGPGGSRPGLSLSKEANNQRLMRTEANRKAGRMRQTAKEALPLPLAREDKAGPLHSLAKEGELADQISHHADEDPP